MLLVVVGAREDGVPPESRSLKVLNLSCHFGWLNVNRLTLNYEQVEQPLLE